MKTKRTSKRLLQRLVAPAGGEANGKRSRSGVGQLVVAPAKGRAELENYIKRALDWMIGEGNWRIEDKRTGGGNSKLSSETETP